MIKINFTNLIFIPLSILIILLMKLTGLNYMIFVLLLFELSFLCSYKSNCIYSIIFSLWCCLIIYSFFNIPFSIAICVIFLLNSIAISIYNEIRSRNKNEFSNSFLDVVRAFVNTIDAKSPITHSHSQRVSEYCFIIGKNMGLSKNNLNKLECAAVLHDIGKIAMPDNILDKPAKLSDYEFDIMKSHVLKGFALLNDIKDMEEIAEIVLSHHEKFDGTGYPNHKKGNDIPLLSRIITVADSYDVITSSRPYKRTLDMDYAINELISCKGTHFDGHIVDVFVDCLASGKVHKIENHEKKSTL